MNNPNKSTSSSGPPAAGTQKTPDFDHLKGAGRPASAPPENEDADPVGDVHEAPESGGGAGEVNVDDGRS